MNVYTDQNFTVTETFKAVINKAPEIRNRTVTVNQRYHGSQVMSYEVMAGRNKRIFPSDLFWLAFSRK